MAEESSARENPQQDVILIQEAVGDSLQGFRAVPPGASPTVDPINRNSASGVSALDGMNGGGITTTSRPHYVMMQDPPLLAPMGRAFSLDARPNETSGFRLSVIFLLILDNLHFHFEGRILVLIVSIQGHSKIWAAIINLI